MSKDSGVYIHISMYEQDANKVVNRAIYLSGNYNNSEVNTIHLFLAGLNNTKIGDDIKDSLGKSYKDIVKTFEIINKDGRFGNLDSRNIAFTPDYFDEAVIEFLNNSIRIALQNSHRIIAEDIMKLLIEEPDEKLEYFLEKIGLTEDMVVEILRGDFGFPEGLETFLTDINELVKEKNETYYGIEDTVDKLIETLCRKNKPNPCIVGPAGVGKTTVLYRLVQRINSGDVPDELKDKHVVGINGATITAGTRYRGEFEERIHVITEWAKYYGVILFLDEMHSFFVAGGNTESGNTAGSMIKEPLSNGDIHIIGATTEKEYHKFIECDTALERRLQKINVFEPSIENSIKILNNTKHHYEEFHNIKIKESTVDDIVKLSSRYIKNNQLPDKAFTVLDQACTKAKLLGKKTLSDDIVLNTLSEISGVKVEKLKNDGISKLKNLNKTISKNLIGQADAVETVCNAIKRSKTGIRNFNRPIASFLFVGPTGVGKTELCKLLSKEVADGKNPLIKFDMSEYTEEVSITKLIGSAPGYVGYSEGGQLTEKVKNNPFSIILFDEIEKAHPKVFNLFLQLLDEGVLTDSSGTKVDFTNCIVVMTSNAGYGADAMVKSNIGFSNSSTSRTKRELEDLAKKALEETFKPEFLNRLDNIVIFNALGKEEAYKVTKIMLSKLNDRMHEQNINITFTNNLIWHISEAGFSDKYGARNLSREIQDVVEIEIADAIIDKRIKSGDSITIDFIDNKVTINKCIGVN